jgi:hypothetical protein
VVLGQFAQQWLAPWARELADRLQRVTAEAHMNTRLLITLCLGAFLVALAASSLRAAGLQQGTRALQEMEPLR